MENTKSDQNVNKKPKKNVLLYSCFIFILGILTGYFFIYQKIETMKLGLDLTYSYKAIAASPFCISMGLYFSLFRINNDGHFRDLSYKDKRTFVIDIILTSVSVIVTVIWFNSQMLKYGYN